MKAVLVNYGHDPQDWWLKYGLEARVYDRSDDGVERIFNAETYRTTNVGDVDFDKLSYLVENYHTLPDVFVWGKSNLFKYVDEEYFKEKLDKGVYAPLLKQDHKTYSDQFGVVCKYQGEMYMERADSWFFNNPQLDRREQMTWEKWCNLMQLPQEAFIPFPPGGNFILTRERVHRYAPEYYARMRDMLPYAKHPAEAHACERSYHYLWR